MKTKLLFAIILAALMPVMLAGCLFVSDDDNSTASLGMAFSANPVYSSTWSGRWDFTMAVDEGNGVGVDVTSMDIYHYDLAGNSTGTEHWNSATFAAFFDDCGGVGSYIAPDGQRCGNLVITGSNGYSDFYVYGYDDNGHDVSVSGRLTRYY